MNSLPPELFVHVLSYLPTKDLLRSKGLNSDIAAIVKRNQRLLPRQRIPFTVEMTSYNVQDMVVTVLTFIYKEKKIKVYLNSLDRSVMIYNDFCNIFSRFQESFLPGITAVENFKQFFSHMFDNVEIETFRFDKVEKICENVTKALKDTIVEKNYRFKALSLPWPGDLSYLHVKDYAWCSDELIIKKACLHEDLIDVYEEMCGLFAKVTLIAPGLYFANLLVPILKAFEEGESSFKFKIVSEGVILSQTDETLEFVANRRGMDLCEELRKKTFYDLVTKGEKKTEVTMKRRKDGKILSIFIERKEANTNLSFEIK